MRKKPINILSIKNPFFPSSTSNHSSKKINNKFKKSSTAKCSLKINQAKQKNLLYTSNAPPGINNINNNIYLNLFNKFNNNNNFSLKQNILSPKEIISNRINNSQKNKMKQNLNLDEIPSFSSIKIKNKNTYIQPDLINSMNFKSNKGHINIRINLKNQFINNNNSNPNINVSDYNKNNGNDITEKIKEKDLKIIQLKNNLLKSQEIINGINNNINNSLKNNNNKHTTRTIYNLNKSSREKNCFMLTKSSGSFDKILKTAYYEYNINILNNKKQNKKTNKNSFLKKSENINKNKNKDKNFKINNLLYTTKKNKKQNDYLRLYLPSSDFFSDKLKFTSYSNDSENIRNQINNNFCNTEKNQKHKIYLNNTNNNKKNNFSDFKKKCDILKERTKNLINHYITLTES